LNADEIYRRIIFRLPSPHYGTLAFNPARNISFYDFLFPGIDFRAAQFSGSIACSGLKPGSIRIDQASTSVRSAALAA
jgi:hypothetical protein